MFFQRAERVRIRSQHLQQQSDCAVLAASVGPALAHTESLITQMVIKGLSIYMPAVAGCLLDTCFGLGMLVCCRPDTYRSRPFRSLSGGQQALATLALSFALQAAFPAPFYFFDEIDSALDTSNASRVADYIASQHGAQYLVVSHKPQVQPSCCLGSQGMHGIELAAV